MQRLGGAGRRTLVATGLLVLLAVAIGGLVLVRMRGMSLRPEAVRDLLQRLGSGSFGGLPVAPLVLIVLLALVLVVPVLPAVIFQTGSGLAFGPAWGLVYVLLADALGAAAGFWLARRWGAAVLRRWLKPATVDRVERLARRLSWQGVMLLRLLPGPGYPLVSIAAGLSRLSFGRYLLASLAGVLPSLALLVLAGDVATRSPLLGVVIVLALVGSLALMGRFFKRDATTADPPPRT